MKCLFDLTERGRVIYWFEKCLFGFVEHCPTASWIIAVDSLFILYLLKNICACIFFCKIINFARNSP